jgi:hypothetical protein
MKFKLLFFALIFSCFSWGQSIFDNPLTFASAVQTSPYTAGQTFDPNLSVSGIVRGSGIVGSAASNRYNATGWNSPTLDSNKYFEFTLTPNSGFQINFSSFVYNGQASGTGATTTAFRSSLDAFTSDIGTASSTGTTISLALPSYQNITSTITFRIYGWGASASGGTFSINDFTFNGTVTATCSSPTIQGTAFTPSLVTTNSATIGLTRGNGNRVLIVGRAGVAVNEDPVSGTSYLASSIFGSGTQIGTGNFVVYDGLAFPNISVALTNLVASTVYHFAVYEYNTSGTCYNLVELTGNFTTAAATPNAIYANNGIQVTAANVAQGTTNHILHKFQITVSAATTNLTGIANLVMNGTYLASDIVNFKIRYSTDNVLDIGDTTLSTKTSGLTGNQTFSLTTQTLPIGVSYVFITADFSATAVVGNTIGTSAPNPLTSTNIVISSGTESGVSTASALQTIMPIAPDVPTTLTEICTSNTSQSLSWSPPATGIFDGYMLVVREAATPHAVTSLVASTQTFNANYALAPTYGSTAILSRVLYIGSATTATITGLTTGVNYTFQVLAYKNNGATSLFSSTGPTQSQDIRLPEVTGAGSAPLNNSGTISWINPSMSCLSEIFAVVTTAPGITFVPTGDGSSYSANSVYAAPNQVVYQGTGSFVTITGLTNGITYYVEIFVRNGTQWSLGVEVSVTPNASTVFKPGELLFVGFDGQVEGTGQSDEYMVATMVDILAGTTFSLVNSRYEAGAAANVRTNKWGGSGDDPSLTPGVVNITYNTGQPLIPAGSVLVLRTNGSINVFSSITIITGTTVSANRVADFTMTLPFGGATTAPNISTGSNAGEQIYLVQGNFVYDGTTEPTEANYMLLGTLLHGFTIKIGWIPLTASCDGTVGSTFQRQSRLPAVLTCFNIEIIANNIVGYYENSAQHGSTSLRNIIQGIANNTSNWTISNSRYTIDAASNLVSKAGKAFIIGAGNPNGQWRGDVDNNWFNCANWERLTVPDEFTDVIVDPATVTDVSNAVVNATSTFSDTYNDIAVCKNLTINGREVTVDASPLNKIEVYGNLEIGGGGILDMSDGTNGTPDGQLYLYGNWTNNGSETNFKQGESTIHFKGSTPQIINNVIPRGTELFYNVVLDNDFNTALSNDLIAQGDLTINATKTLNIDSNGFVYAYKKLDHNGILSIANNGQFIQVDEIDNNMGVYTGTNFQLTRTAQAKNFDYVYWSSPTENYAVSNLPNNYRYEWNTLFANTNGTQGNWTVPSGNMIKGKGYIARASNGSTTPIGLSTIFTGKPHNGQFNFGINRGTFDGADFDADLTDPNNLLTTRFDDNWNLVGNPYPSAIDAEEFLVQNQTKIEGAVWVWKHGLDPTSNVSPFYSYYQYNYSSSDYIKYNGLGSTEPDTFVGIIASGQGFMVNMLHTAATPNTITFTNNMRSDASLVQYNNTDFLRGVSTNTVTPVEEKHRIWLDIINNDSGQTDRTLVGYSTNSTLDVDHMYDCFFRLRSELSMYSIINSEPFIIQGRPLPFNNLDLVPMGINIVAFGNHTIAIKKVDGLFEQNQDIYLEDKLLNIIHDLRQAPYNFTSAIGTFNDRFVLRYVTEALNTENFESIESSVFMSAHDGQIKIRTINALLSEVTVYDVLGREIIKKTNIASSNLTLSNITVKNQTLIVKIKLVNGEIITRKVVL